MEKENASPEKIITEAVFYQFKKKDWFDPQKITIGKSEYERLLFDMQLSKFEEICSNNNRFTVTIPDCNQYEKIKSEIDNDYSWISSILKMIDSTFYTLQNLTIKILPNRSIPECDRIEKLRNTFLIISLLRLVADFSAERMGNIFSCKHNKNREVDAIGQMFNTDNKKFLYEIGLNDHAINFLIKFNETSNIMKHRRKIFTDWILIQPLPSFCIYDTEDKIYPSKTQPVADAIAALITLLSLTYLYEDVPPSTPAT